MEVAYPPPYPAGAIHTEKGEVETFHDLIWQKLGRIQRVPFSDFYLINIQQEVPLNEYGIQILTPLAEI
jgi:hypothetical protein